MIDTDNNMKKKEKTNDKLLRVFMKVIDLQQEVIERQTKQIQEATELLSEILEDELLSEILEDHEQ